MGFLKSIAEQMQEATLADFRALAPDLTDDDIRAEILYGLVRHAPHFTEYEEVGMRCRRGQGVDGEHMLLEVVDEDIREKFDFMKFYDVVGPRHSKSGKPKAFGFNNEPSASSRFDKNFQLILRGGRI